MALPAGPARGRQAAEERSSFWGSDESRDFLEERLNRFAGVCLGISLFFFFAGWAIAWRWAPDQLVHGLPIAATHLLYLAAIAVTFLVWLATRGATLPGAVRRAERRLALGATAYFLLTGTTVFEGSLGEVFAKLAGEAPAPPSKRTGRPIPARLEALVLDALAKDPDRRPDSMEAFRAALAAIESDAGWTAREADAWWRSRGARIREGRSGGEPPEYSPRTVDVARGARNGSRETSKRDDERDSPGKTSPAFHQVEVTRSGLSLALPSLEEKGEACAT